MAFMVLIGAVFGSLVLMAVLAVIFQGITLIITMFVMLVALLTIIIVVMRGTKSRLPVFAATIVIIALVAAMFLSGFGFMGLMALKPGDYHDNTVVGIDRIAEGTALSDPIDVRYYGGFEGGEMLDSVAFTASHRTTGPGETVHIWVKYCQTNTAESGPTSWASRFAFFVYFSTGSSWSAEPSMIIELPGPPAAICPQTSNFDFGSVKLGSDVGYIKVQLYVRAWANGYNKGYHDHIVVEDMAEVRSGVGAITEPRMGYLAKVGETITIKFKLGWGCSVSTKADDPARTFAEGGGWSAAIYSEAKGMEKIAEWTTNELGCGGSMTPEYKTVSYTVQSDDFDNEGGCKQTLFIELYNNLFMVAEKYTYTLDVSKAFELPKPKITAEKTQVYVGDSVTFTAESSTADAEYIWVAAYLDGEILKTQNGTSSNFEVTPNRKGEMEITVNCRDRSDCSFSQPDSIKIMVYEKGTTIPPPYMDWLPMVLLVIILIVAVAFSLWLVKPMWLKLLVTFLLALIILGAAWWLGVF